MKGGRRRNGYKGTPGRKKKERDWRRTGVERLKEEEEEAAGRQDLKTLYKINKILYNGFKNNDVPVKDTDGNVF